ncbi:hypothetical protein RA8CHR_01489 [Variovorax sp. RA8]|nr:hypothetical protein RA8CHR_01489 [Variovorax sp. RA8]
MPVTQGSFLGVIPNIGNTPCTEMGASGCPTRCESLVPHVAASAIYCLFGQQPCVLRCAQCELPQGEKCQAIEGAGRSRLRIQPVDATPTEKPQAQKGGLTHDGSREKSTQVDSAAFSFCRGATRRLPYTGAYFHGTRADLLVATCSPRASARMTPTSPTRSFRAIPHARTVAGSRFGSSANWRPGNSLMRSTSASSRSAYAAPPPAW